MRTQDDHNHYNDYKSEIQRQDWNPFGGRLCHKKGIVNYDWEDKLWKNQQEKPDLSNMCSHLSIASMAMTGDTKNDPSIIDCLKQRIEHESKNNYSLHPDEFSFYMKAVNGKDLPGCTLNMSRQYSNSELTEKIKRDLPIGHSTVILSREVDQTPNREYNGNTIGHYRTISRLDENKLVSYEGDEFNLNENPNFCLDSKSGKCHHYTYEERMRRTNSFG